MTARLVALCIDANDPPRVAGFWARALRWTVGSRSHEEVALIPPDDTSFGIVVRRVASEKSGQNRIHLDLTTSSIEDRDRTVAQLIEMGARHVDVGQTGDEGHVVLADPEGNEFCVIEPTNNFLAMCPRLGSITCDGTPEVGYFWSEALAWPLVWDQDDETAIRAPDLTGPMITWGGPPLLPKVAENRLHLHVAPLPGGDQRAEVNRLIALGATPIDIGDDSDVDVVAMADPDGNEFCVLPPR